MNDDDREELEQFLRAQGLPQGRVFVARIDDLSGPDGGWQDLGAIGEDGFLRAVDPQDGPGCPNCGGEHDDPSPFLQELMSVIAGSFEDAVSGPPDDHVHVSFSRPPGRTVDAPPAQPDRPAPSLAERIDRAIDGLCPCGNSPDQEYAPYCSYDCVPNTAADDTDTGGPGWRPEGFSQPTPMRWRPDLVTATTEDPDLEPRLSRALRGNRYWTEVFRRRSTGALHLRLDDGYRFVGVDLEADEDDAKLERIWVRLERQLTSESALDPEPDEGDGCDCPACTGQLTSVDVMTMAQLAARNQARRRGVDEDLLRLVEQRRRMSDRDRDRFRIW